jgi:signal transduction histidine kinase
MQKVITAVMSDSTVKYVANAVSADVTLRGKWKKTSDALISDGITSDMLVTVKKGEDNPHANLHHQVKEVIKGTFTKHVQTCLGKELKVLNDQDKETKRYWTKQVSSYFNKVRTHLENAEKLAEDESSGTITPRVAKTKVSRIKKHLNDVLDILKSLEDAKFNIPETQNNIKAILITIKE